VLEWVPVGAGGAPTLHGVAARDQDLLAVTENGYGKRTPLSEYRPQGRGGKGLITIRCSERNGRLVAIRNVRWQGQELAVAAGAGLVVQSRFDAEWNEVVLKCGAVKRTFGL